MLIEIAIGDAYGAGFEFCDRERIAGHNNLAQYIGHPLGISVGHYTDDTQMSLAVAEVILNVEAPSAHDFAEGFVRAYRRDPRAGYAAGFHTLLEQCHTGKDLLDRIRPSSRRNGAAMRSVPLGLIPDRKELLSIAETQAAVTHNTEAGIRTSQAVALMAHLLFYQQAAIAELPDLVERELGLLIAENWCGEVECDAMQTVHAVNTALQRNRQLSTLLIDCVSFGGDTDSVAAIACGIASLSNEYTNDIPRHLIDGLENGIYGRQYLIELDRELATRYE